MMNKPMYLHGREGSPCGSKGSYMQFKLTCGAHAPNMPATSTNPNAFDESYAIAYQKLKELQQQGSPPSVIVGSSFGGAVLMKLVQEGHWHGPSVFLAPAPLKKSIRQEYNLPLWDDLPKGHRAIFIHSPTDNMVLYTDSETIKANAEQRNQEQGLIELWPAKSTSLTIDKSGNHRLHEITKDGTLRRALEQLLDKSLTEHDEKTFHELRSRSCTDYPNDSTSQ